VTLKKLPISVAKQIAEQHGFDSVIVIGFVERGFTACSYGTTKHNCRETGLTLDAIADGIGNESIRAPDLCPAAKRATAPTLPLADDEAARREWARRNNHSG
jgi:hypothetical protein